MKIVFLGTPDFAVESLQAVYDAGHEILAVVTQPDKERNRREVTFSPVKQRALDLGLKVLQFSKIREEGEEILRELAPDVMVTCAYGQIISQSILDIPKYGVINVHASLLPLFRGSSPIQWAILTGQKRTGVSIMRTALQVDSGDVLLQKSVDIGEDETAGELFDRLANLGAEALVEGLGLIESGRAVFTPQDHSKATHYPMLSKEDGHIDWNSNAQEILCKIRGMNPWPSAYCYLDGKIFKIWRAKVAQDELGIGEIQIQGKSMKIGCGDGAIEALEVQLEGKRRMDTASFVAGVKIQNGTIVQ
ncbi:MAG: methionyl-tRNA formyltransferase [Clostridia bacterium]|nr:methionyl-tRNA formyltransferase [Clostridia bacterium]MDY4083496.1 methionyl-tRNA formyltransferase [Eubacteriales bacterium]